MTGLSVGTWQVTAGVTVVCAPRSIPSPEDRARGRHPRESTIRLVTRPTTRLVDLEGVSVETILTRIRDGDTEALAVLYRTLFPSLWRLAMLRAGSTALAEEMVHDVFLALWLRREHLPMDVDIHVYLAVAVRNRARDWHAHARVVRGTEDAVTHALLDPPAINQGSAPPDVLTESHEFVAAYHRALAALSDREREAALLRWEEGLSFEQIAVVLGLSKNGVRKILLRAQARVQTDLAAYRD